MTRRDALRALEKAVVAGKKCIIPTPHRYAKESDPTKQARIMGYVDGYTVLRHKGAAPFLEATRDVLSHLRALIAREGGE